MLQRLAPGLNAIAMGVRECKWTDMHDSIGDIPGSSCNYVELRIKLHQKLSIIDNTNGWQMLISLEFLPDLAGFRTSNWTEIRTREFCRHWCVRTLQLLIKFSIKTVEVFTKTSHIKLSISCFDPAVNELIISYIRRLIFSALFIKHSPVYCLTLKVAKFQEVSSETNTQ